MLGEADLCHLGHWWASMLVLNTTSDVDQMSTKPWYILAIDNSVSIAIMHRASTWRLSYKKRATSTRLTFHYDKIELLLPEHFTRGFTHPMPFLLAYRNMAPCTGRELSLLCLIDTQLFSGTSIILTIPCQYHVHFICW